MTTTLRRVLDAFEQADSTLRLDTLSRELGLNPGTLDSMIQHWVRKGRITQVCDSVPGGCHSCGMSGDCPFVMNLPRRYRLARPKELEGVSNRVERKRLSDQNLSE